MEKFIIELDDTNFEHVFVDLAVDVKIAQKAAQQIQSVKGMNDRLGDEAAKWAELVRRCTGALIRAGYASMETPFVEPGELYTHSLGETTEVVQKQMYRVHDPKERGYVLRPEGTASAVRAFIQAGLDRQERAFRFHYAGPMFRYERPQKGRLRQFHQVGAEMFGVSDVSADIEMLIVADRLLAEAGVSGARLHLNTLGGAETRLAYRAKLLDFLRSVAKDLPEEITTRMEANPLRVLDSKDPEVKRVTAAAPALGDALTEADRAAWEQLRETLDKLGIEYVYDPRLVRGLDYYNGMVFEYLAENLGAQNAVLAGGRYDGLVASLGGRTTPAVGFAAGLERLFELATGLEAGLTRYVPELVLANVGVAERTAVLKLYTDLLSRGVAVRVEADSRSVKAKLRSADKNGARSVLVIGEQEARDGRGKIKILGSGAEVEVSLDPAAILAVLEANRG